jgi:quinol monooxygenase YgiN
MMSGQFYTLASWHVREGQTEAFLQIWRDELAAAFRALNPLAQGTLIQSLEDPNQFVSFGPWASLEEMQAARSAPQVREAIGKLMALCDDARPGPYRVVLTIP